MKKIAVAALVPMLFVSVSAHAMENAKVDPKLCALNAQTPASADYQPGVDVNGNKVAPADLPGQHPMQMPQKIDIPLTGSLAKILNLNTNQGVTSKLGPGTEAQLGSFSVDTASGKVAFNGKPLTDDQEAQLSVLCANEKPAKR